VGEGQGGEHQRRELWHSPMEQGEQEAGNGGGQCHWQVDFRQLPVLQFFHVCKAGVAAGDYARFQLQQIDELRGWYL